jgi:Zn-dependent protease
MLPTRQGSFRLFRLFGIDVFLHWSWFLILVWRITVRKEAYSALFWPILEVLTLFGIVLMHEFGHALACRQVGGKADQIVLWPLGGVAYVSPPQRPGPVLWSIVAGPLVNLLLVPVFAGAWMLASSVGWEDSVPDGYHFVVRIFEINLVLLVFNMLPIYPLDGGQILQALLWFVLGRARSLMVATVLGFIGAGGLIVVALYSGSLSGGGWLGILCIFALLNCWQGLMRARVLARIAKMPHRGGFACPDCHQPPIIGPFWRCDRCQKPFDTFETHATCPHCGAQFAVTRCPECGRAHPFAAWVAQGASDRPPRL